MKASVGNVLPGTVKQVLPGSVNPEVIIELASGVEIVSVISKHSAEDLKLEPGKKVSAVIKASTS